ncbi:ubiquitin carboxyl-terminal hydrolase 10-like isoform X3 [Anneissia japonica]|uniref:ubiquitin carboxyl-terminal hydrolase 10-like isoform X3 n=1 Tax=Anneissia japonica TaxID=1529436 RepID=UPI001425B50D|nr:ubiquitin carboxyl-terminal hydrolase 10-like isoform X3 [Anneissia japonica]
MSLPNTILSFGDFSEGDEVGSLNYLLASLGRPIKNSKLELPWNEEEHLKEVSADTVPNEATGISFGTVDLKGENFSFTVGKSSLNSSVKNTAVEFDDKVFGQSHSDDRHRKPRRNKKKRDERYYEDFYKNQEFTNDDASQKAIEKETFKHQSYPVNELLNKTQSEIGHNVNQNADVINFSTASNRTINLEQSYMPDLIPNIASMQGAGNVQQQIPTDRQNEHNNVVKNLAQVQQNSVASAAGECFEKTLGNNAENTTSTDDDKANEESESNIDIPLNKIEAVGKTEQESTYSNLQSTNESKDGAQMRVPEQNQPVVNKPSSWAGLFSKPAMNTKGKPDVAENKVHSVPDPAAIKQIVEQIDERKPVSVDFDSYAKQLGDLLSKVQLNHRPVAWQPRGLNNKANWCYINSILQALLFCPPFGNLIRSIPVQVKERLPTSTPMLDCIIDFVNMYEVMPHRQSGKRITDIQTGSTFEPVQVYQMLSRAKTSFSVEGRQEDAEEFLGCLLNGMHEEMLALMAVDKPQSTSVSNGLENDNEEDDEYEEDEDEWHQVGPKNKSSVTREAHFDKSPISEIFGGQMRSILHQSGSRESATLQPFFTLQLDIQSNNIWSVSDALEHMVSKETLHGYTCSKTKTEVEASRRITIEKLPPVLVLHLKRFIYDKSGGCQKMMKRIDYSVDLELGKELFSSTVKGKLGGSQRWYKLFAVVYHLGEEASGGHYITDIFHPAVGGWLRTDDSIVKVVPVSQVLKPTLPRLPYLLFYRQRDL